LILATREGNRSVQSRDLFAGTDRIPLPGSQGGVWSAAGRWVSTKDAVGLPAVLSAIRVLAETVGSLPMIVYRQVGDNKERAQDSSQWALLHDKPCEGVTPMALWSHIVAAQHGWGGAYVLKMKAQGKVVQLGPLQADRVTPRVDGGQLVFDVRDQDSSYGVKTLTRSSVLYIPGILYDHPLIGISPIAMHRQALGTGLALEEYGGRFFSNDATPGGVLQIPGDLSKPQRDEMREAWDSEHRGGENAHKLGVLIGGSTYQQVGISPHDAQYVDGQRFTVEQVARIFRIPTWLLAGADPENRVKQEEKNLSFLQFSLAPWLVRIEQALLADDDLFPDKTMTPEFLADGLLRADTATRYAAYVQARQAGWLSANEIRAMENRPPVEGGDNVQATPVGGAVNPGTPTAPTAPAESTDIST